jgi:hypothetical protein
MKLYLLYFLMISIAMLAHLGARQNTKAEANNAEA